jgi:hypothetical protein
MTETCSLPQNFALLICLIFIQNLLPIVENNVYTLYHISVISVCFSRIHFLSQFRVAIPIFRAAVN